MWKEKQYRYEQVRSGGEDPSIKSFFTRRRKWGRLSFRLCASMGTNSWTVPGVFLDLDEKGFKRTNAKFCITHALNGDFSLESSRHIGEYFFSKQCRFIRIKVRNHRSTPKKQKHTFSHWDYKRQQLWRKREKITERESSVTKNPSVRKDDDDDNSGDDEEEYEDDEEMMEGQRTHYIPKHVPRNLRYLYSDKYVEKRKSKRKSILVEDSVHKVHEKSKFREMRKSTSFLEDKENDIIQAKPRLAVTFGDFFCSEYIAKFGLEDSRSESRTSVDNKGDYSDELDILNANATENVARDHTHSVDLSDISDEKSSEQRFLPECEDQEASNFDEFESAPNLSSRTASTREENADDVLNEKREIANQKPLTLLLSRLATRPDNLRQDFKLNYKEAKCKPRRFIINISHLAYQNFVLNAREPLNILPQLDLSLYLVFSFVREVRTDADEYRVQTSTALPLVDCEHMLAHLCSGQVQSIHEIMQTTITALNTLNLNKIRKNSHVKLRDGIAHKAMHSFNLLTSACKWNIQIIDYPHSIEWSEDFSNKLALQFSPTVSDETLLSKVTSTTSNVASFSKANVGSNAVKQGPNKPSLCGICLKDFGENDFYFPMALCFCSHWFCEACWKAASHFHTNKTKHSHQFLCLEEGCTSPIDSATLLSFLPVQVVRDFEFWKWKTAIENTPQLILCPNPSCNKIIFAKDTQQSVRSNVNDKSINLTCSCLYQKCFSCLSNPHWPVSCAIAKIYQRRMNSLNHDIVHRQLEDKELPNMALMGKSCPKCSLVIFANFQFSGQKNCSSCGCDICWPCGKEVHESQRNQHLSCVQQFQTDEIQSKEHLNSKDRYLVKNGDVTRWYKIALLHRRNQHPQVVNILHQMASHVAETISEVSRRGKYIGNVKQAALGGKKQFRKVAERKLSMLSTADVTRSMNQTAEYIESTAASCINSPISECKFAVENNKSIDDNNCINYSPRSNSSLSVTESLLMDRQSPLDSNIIASTLSPRCDPLIMKAMLNVVDAKLELHHVIEHVAVLLEYSHTLYQPGRIIRCLERAEDMCTYLDMLLQPTHVDGSSRIIPSFLRLRTQCASLLTTLCCNLRGDASSHSNDSK